MLTHHPMPLEDLSHGLSQDLLNRLDISQVSFLGGRVNKHWRVQFQGETLVLRKWAPQPPESIAYEREFLNQLKMIGWSVAPFDEPQEFESSLWSLSPFLPGKPLASEDPHEQKTRGRLLAEFHASTAQIELKVQRSGWRRCEETLADPELDRILSANESIRSEEVRIIRWHLDRARQRIEGLNLKSRPSIPVHGDFTTWNLLYQDGNLSGVIDFELARNDHRVADFALAWRGKYDSVIEGYEEVSPLEPEERAMLVPIWWASLIEGACRDMKQGKHDDGWAVNKLLARSPIMGIDAEAMPR